MSRGRDPVAMRGLWDAPPHHPCEAARSTVEPRKKPVFGTAGIGRWYGTIATGAARSIDRERLKLISPVRVIWTVARVVEREVIIAGSLLFTCRIGGLRLFGSMRVRLVNCRQMENFVVLAQIFLVHLASDYGRAKSIVQPIAASALTEFPTMSSCILPFRGPLVVRSGNGSWYICTAAASFPRTSVIREARKRPSLRRAPPGGDVNGGDGPFSGSDFAAGANVALCMQSRFANDANLPQGWTGDPH